MHSTCSLARRQLSQAIHANVVISLNLVIHVASVDRCLSLSVATVLVSLCTLSKTFVVVVVQYSTIRQGYVYMWALVG